MSFERDMQKCHAQVLRQMVDSKIIIALLCITFAATAIAKEILEESFVEIFSQEIIDEELKVLM